jgi:hypothetical protein
VFLFFNFSLVDSLEPPSTQDDMHTYDIAIGSNCLHWQEDLFSPLRRSIFETDAYTADRLWTLWKQRDTGDL